MYCQKEFCLQVGKINKCLFFAPYYLMTNFQSTFDLYNKKTLQIGCQNTDPGNYYLNNNSNYTLLMHILNTMLLLFSPFNPFLYPRKCFFRRRWWNLMSELPKLLCIASQQSIFQRTKYEKIIVHFERIFIFDVETINAK